MAFNLVDVKTIYGEDKNLKEKDVKTVVKWVQSQPHLPNIGGKFRHFATNVLPPNHPFSRFRSDSFSAKMSLSSLAYPDRD